MNFAIENGRGGIGAPDKLFGVSARAKERIAQIGKENVIDSTIGVLLDDDGKLAVLDSVDKCVKALTPDDYAPYAPILGTEEYISAVKKAVFMDSMPDTPVEACYTPYSRRSYTGSTSPDKIAAVRSGTSLSEKISMEMCSWSVRAAVRSMIYW